MIKLIVLLISLTILNTSADENWSRFRGESGLGTSQSTLPAQLSSKNLVWSIDLNGDGSSSPVIWGQKLFVTAKSQNGLKLMAINTETGKNQWTQELSSGTYNTHKFNNVAASTPCLTEKHVILPWYNAAKNQAALTAFNHSGKKLWEKDLGEFKSKHGYTANPATLNNIVVTTMLHHGNSAVLGIDINSGKELWKFPCPSGDASYSTPLIRNNHTGEYEVIITGGSLGMLSLNLTNGKKNWLLPKAYSSRTVNSQIELSIGGESFICASQKGKDFCAVKLPSKTTPQADYFWQQRKIGAYVPSVISQRGLLYILQGDGSLTAYDFKAKKKISQVKLRANFYSSPIFVGSLLYCQSRSGKLFIVDTQPTLKVTHTLDLNPPEDADWLDATPAVVNNKLFIRLGSRLDCYK